MRKVYYLSTCSTSKRILKDFNLKAPEYELQDIKMEPITAPQLEELKDLAGSYEALFSRIARKYKEWKLKDKILLEEDYKKLILEEYTLLKRPVITIENKIFIGNSKGNLEALAAELKS